MASENNEISDIVKKCKILLLDIEGTTTSISFVKDKLFPYAEANVKEFLESQWEDREVKEAVSALRKLAIEDQDKNVEGVVTIPGEGATKEEQIEGLVKSVQWQMSADRKAGPLKYLQGLIWKQGYDKGDIKGHVFDDVAPALELWRSTEGQKVYIYSSGSIQAQKLLFSRSVAGDLLPHIEGHFDTAIGAKKEATSYAAIVEKVGCKPEDILFLTDVVKEAEAARASGLQVALVSREGNAPLPTEATTTYPVLHSFDQLTVSNKRKPDPQEEEVPAKVPKTDIEAGVKTATEMEASESIPETTPASEIATSSETVAASENITAPETVSKVADEPEKMEVEEEIPVVETASIPEQVENVSSKVEDTPICIETVVEEIATPDEAGDAPVCDIEPVIEESVEKTEKNETEMMETESIENVVTVDTDIKPKQPAQEIIDEQSSVNAKTQPADEVKGIADSKESVITEESPPAAIIVEDVTNNQESVNDAEILDVEPVVEEPVTIEMDDLKNVGDVLEKECDEILSKVQDVTNLENIPIKPLLSSIAEEPMESENGENTNDIVESILDSEMELAAKSQNIEVNKLPEIKITETDATEQKTEKVESSVEEVSVKENNKLAENAAESNNTTDNVVEEKNNKKAVEENKNKEEIKEKSSTETATEEITPLAEVTNGDQQESIPEIKEKTITDSLTKPESNVVDCKEAQATVETVDNKIASEASLASPDDEKMESEESATETAETKENKNETTDTIAEPVDNKMETTESIADPVENKADVVKSTLEPVVVEESKVEAKESVDSEMETVDSSDRSVENKKEESATESLENKKEDAVESVEKKAETTDSITEQVDNKLETEGNPAVTQMESEESTPQDNKIAEKEENKIVETVTVVPESKVTENNTEKKETTETTAPDVPTETKDKSTEDVQMETAVTEAQVNGKTNGEPEVNVNGNASKDEELSARLSVENGKNGNDTNGANGNGESVDDEKGQGDNKVESGKAEIKVKTVASEESHTDPIEQPVEA